MTSSRKKIPAKRNLTPLVVGAGVALGCIMILSACLVYILHQQFGYAGGVLTVFGAILLGLSVWRTIDISISPKEGIKAKFDQRFDQMERNVKEVVHQVRVLETHLLTNISALDGAPSDRVAEHHRREKVDFLRKHGSYEEALEIDPDDVLSLMHLIEKKAIESEYPAITKLLPRLNSTNQSGVGYSVYPQVILAQAQEGDARSALNTLAELDRTIDEHVSNGHGYLARAEQLSWLYQNTAEVKAKVDDGSVVRALETFLEKIEATVRDLMPRSMNDDTTNSGRTNESSTTS